MAAGSTSGFVWAGRDLALLTSALGSFLHRTFRDQELCESLAAMAVLGSPSLVSLVVSVDVKHHEKRHLFCRDLVLLTSALASCRTELSELRSCVKV